MHYMDSSSPGEPSLPGDCLIAGAPARCSHAHLKAGKHAEATADAEACVAADPTLEKGHMRLLLALEAAPEPCLTRQLEACERGLRACPVSSSARRGAVVYAHTHTHHVCVCAYKA